MDIYWLEQNTSNVPELLEWLSSNEAKQVDALRFLKRRSDWILGRWTAKLAFCLWLGLQPDFETLASIDIRTTECGSPEVLLTGKRAEVDISLSHSNQIAMCVLGPKGIQLGCDLERVERRSKNFVEDYFTIDEQACIASAPLAQREQLVNILWSAKESVLKALHVGLRESTNRVQVLRVSGGVPGTGDEGSWAPLLLSCADGRLFRGFWRQADNLVRTVVYPVGIFAQMIALQPVDYLSCAATLQCVKSRH